MHVGVNKTGRKSITEKRAIFPQQTINLVKWWKPLLIAGAWQKTFNLRLEFRKNVKMQTENRCFLEIGAENRKRIKS